MVACISTLYSISLQMVGTVKVSADKNDNVLLMVFPYKITDIGSYTNRTVVTEKQGYKDLV